MHKQRARLLWNVEFLLTGSWPFVKLNVTVGLDGSIITAEACSACGQVDVWALGVSAIEMAEVTPPRWAVHPMRVIFMIPREPSPQLAEKQRWSPAFHSFLAAALRKVSGLQAAEAVTHPRPAPMPVPPCHQCFHCYICNLK
jgi:hypothetical protein